MTITFKSVADYSKFIGAREFRHPDGKLIESNKNILEKVGGLLTKPVLGFSDIAFRNITNPLVITAITIMAIAVITIVFYPTTFIATIAIAIPKLLLLQPWMAKFAIYVLAECTILGLGIRGVGRLNNPTLIDAYTRGQLVPISVGSTQKRS
jgi:hypothetical protein